MREVFVIPSVLYFCKKASNEKCHCMITFYLMRRLKDYRATLIVSFQIFCSQYNFNPLKWKHQYMALNLSLLANECSIFSTFFYINIDSKIMKNFYWMYSIFVKCISNVSYWKYKMTIEIFLYKISDTAASCFETCWLETWFLQCDTSYKSWLLDVCWVVMMCIIIMCLGNDFLRCSKW